MQLMKLQADTIRLKPRHALATLCLAAAALTAAPQHSFFAGSENILLQEVPGVAAGQPLWFHVTRGGRTLASGPVAATADGHLTLPLTLPEMKPGVVLALDLTLRLGSDQGAPLFANTKAWFFSRYPWPADHNPVAPHQLHLYDPVGDTTRRLLLATVKERPWPLDLAAIPTSAPGGTRFKLSATDNIATFDTVPHAGAEALLWELPATGGRIRILGNPLISRWEATPVARWLLADLINTFTNKSAM